MIGNKISDKNTKVSRSSPQNSPEKIEIETESMVFDREIPKERYISPEKGQQIINDLRLIQ